MRFSALTGDLAGSTNRLYERVRRVRAEGAPILDLVRADAAEAGAVFLGEALESILLAAARQAERYRPDPLGQPLAREAVRAYEGVPVGDIVLTPGTSVTYSYLFKILCEAGDEVLCPVPAYPLFDYIGRLEGIEIRHYRLDESRRWRVDLDHLEAQITPRTRAIVLISPHNPTGMVLDRDEVESVAHIAGRHDLPLVSDEVFREFVFEDAAGRPRPSDAEAPLVFTLNGFSKMFALPGFKIGWVAVSGKESLVRKSLAALEMISDTFLPVHEISQFAVPAIFDQGREFLNDYRTRVAACRNAALGALGVNQGIPPEGGFYVVLPYERDVEEEDLAIELLEDAGLLIHPGYFYDIEGRHIVFSFLKAPEVIGKAVSRLKAHL